MAEAVEIYNSIEKQGVIIDDTHKACMVDVYVRAGRLKDAEILALEVNSILSIFIFLSIFNLLSLTDMISWSSVLQGCSMYNNIELAEVVYRRACELDSKDSSLHVLMAR